MSGQMPLYAKGRACPKCKTAGVGSKFCDKKMEPARTSFGFPHSRLCWMLGGYAPHMHRNCFNCQHEWYERPADSKAVDYTAEAIAERGAADQAEKEAAFERYKEHADIRYGSFTSGRRGTLLNEPTSKPWWKP